MRACGSEPRASIRFRATSECWIDQMMNPFTNFEDNDGAPLSYVKQRKSASKKPEADNGKKRKGSSPNDNSVAPKKMKVSGAKFAAVIESARADNEK